LSHSDDLQDKSVGMMDNASCEKTHGPKTLMPQPRMRSIALRCGLLMLFGEPSCIAQASAAGASPAPSSSSSQAARFCEIVAKRFADSSMAKNPLQDQLYGPSPLDALAADQRSGVTRVEPVGELEGLSPKELADWSKKTRPRFALSPEIAEALGALEGGRVVLDRLPGTGFHMASGTRGTAHCYVGVYFEIRNGRAVAAKPPEAFSGGEAEGCGVARAFGSIDGVPTAFEEDYDFGPSMHSSLALSPWDKDRFVGACRVRFTFAPRFDPHRTLNAWEQSCAGPDCESLRQKALALVEAVEKDPLAAQKQAHEIALAEAEQLNSGRLVRRVETETEAPPRGVENPRDPASYTDQTPLTLPLVHAGKLYHASVGHFTIGWRIFGDWSVKLVPAVAGEGEERSFAIGMTRGKLIDFQVK
jgi:hypothetical protein